jgi:hypothetical protein
MNGVATPEIIAGQWAEHAEALADWALARVVVRRDVFGAYTDDGGQITAHEPLTRDVLVRHYRGEPGAVMGLHSTSPDNQCLTVAWDIDAHDEKADPETNRRYARRIAERCRQLGLRALIFDSNGKGGFHVRAFFKKPVPAAVAYWLCQRLVADHADFGFASPPETFPKQPGVTLANPFGNWIRAPGGRHHKREHWTRIYDPEKGQWSEGAAAAQRLVRVAGDKPDQLLAAYQAEEKARAEVQRTGGPATNGTGHGASKRYRTGDLGQPEEDTVRAALGHLSSDWADSYGGQRGSPAWLGVGMALHSWDPVRGLPLWIEHSQQSPKFDEAVCRDKWATFNASGALKIGSIFFEAERNGWVPPWKAKAAASSNGKAGVGSVSSVSDPAEVSPKFEGPPQPIVTVLRPVPPFDPVMLPTPLRAWVMDIADRGQCSLEFPAVGAIIVLASLIGRKLGIRPKRHDVWLVVPNLWGMIVGRPGVLKSYGLEQPMAPLERLAAQAREQYAAALAEHQRDLMVIEAKKEAARGGMKKAAAKEGTPDVILRQWAEKATATLELTPPVERRYKTNDTTVPKLGELLRDNPWGLLLYRDEIPGFFRTLDMQGHESDRSFYLEAWNGTGAFTYDRIGRGTVHIEAVCLSILGGIQPGPLASYLRNMTNGGGDDGLISRFQLAVYPDQDREFKIVDRKPDTGAKNRAFDIFKAFDALNPADVGAEVDEHGGIPFLRFSPDAQEFFYHWWAALEAKLRADEPPTIESHLSKYRSLMPSLALLFHLMDLVDTEEGQPVRKGAVSLSAAKMAAAWCDFLEEHARRIYQSGSDGDMGPARTIAERLAESLPNPFRARNVLRKGWTGLTKVEDVDRALDILEEHGWVCSVKVPTGEKGGAPTVDYHVNPAIAEVEP